jgi:hypothetical protein
MLVSRSILLLNALKRLDAAYLVHIKVHRYRQPPQSSPLSW